MNRPSICLVLVTLVAIPLPAAAQDSNAATRLAAVEAELRRAEERVQELESVLTTLNAEVAAIKATRDAGAVERLPTQPVVTTASPAPFVERMIVPDLGDDERAEDLRPKPELFVQTAYYDHRIDGATPDDAAVNFNLNRVELAWGGRISERIGMGYELQYHPAPDGASEELINDAFVEYYASDALTVRIGQFVKPFGFDIQHSSAERESPERGIFAGYFFPGQRDRGIMLRADLGQLGWLDGATLYAGVFNGNRFFADNNDAHNYNLRFRRLFPSGRFALGASYQSGTQILPPGAAGDDAEDAYGLDAQFVFGRLGFRAEWVRGSTPSTLLSLEPEFARAFAPGDESWGAAALFDYSLSERGDLYWRWDRFDRDPVTGGNPRAFNVGYLHRLGASSRIAVDYQWKNDVTYNDDELNTAFTFRWDVVY